MPTTLCLPSTYPLPRPHSAHRTPLLPYAVVIFLIAIQAMVLFPAGAAGADGLGITQPNQISTLDGFAVELVYEVPQREQGSWVALTIDHRDRLIASDQHGGLYRIDLSSGQAEVNKLDLEIIGAQGLLYAFDSLYANVNHGKFPAGVWRFTDTDGDDQFDKQEHLIELNAGGEHGPHAMVVTPDRQRIFMCAGNNTNLPKQIDRSRVPRVWDEDHLLGRMPDARGHNANRMAPGGFILSMNPDGSDIELICNGFRNEYDIAVNRDGELFAYDADMEWDVGTPWYRPTRINHVISGAEFGWRNGTGKWPEYYPDSFGAAVDIGPGSPTGICFGYGTNYPEKYQNALFVCDWSYGNIHAVHLQPDGSSYSGEYETFATAAPLPVTDILVHPDGMLYFTIGGRRTQSGLYRLRYVGDNKTPTASGDSNPQPAARLRKLRKQIESFHRADPPAAGVAIALANLGHEDRGIRYASRIALEHQPLERWRDQVLADENAQARILGVVALARHGGNEDKADALQALNEIDWKTLTSGQRTDLLRAYGLVGIRLGAITPAEAAPILAKIGDQFPSGDERVDRELAQVLVYLGAENAVARVVDQLKRSPSQENQIHYAMTLRSADQGWTKDLRLDYFQWFNEIQSARGGMSFGGFIKNIKDVAMKQLSDETKEQLSDVLNPANSGDPGTPEKSRPLVKKWTVEELLPAVTATDHKPNYERGKQVFAAAQCYKCHRMGVQGGILGPDLTAAGGRFNERDMLTSIIEPSKVVSDQYEATQFLTDDGRVVVGRIINMAGNGVQVMTNMLDPSKLTGLKRDEIEATQVAKTSMMPAGLLDTFTKTEIADLIAYLRAGGSSSSSIYQLTSAAAGDQADDRQWLEFAGGDGPGAGKHIVLIAGDHEYRSEEAMPQLGKILSEHHGFRCTVLFPIDPETGVIDPTVVTNIPGLEALESADLMILGLRFRNLEDDQMQRIVDYTEAGKPIIGMRTSTHGFNIPKERKFAKYSFNSSEVAGGYGRQVLGETWINHHGHHGKESTRGIVADAGHPIARGIADGDVWGPTDVYGVRLPLTDDGHPIILGQVLDGMKFDSQPVTGRKNDPMMPVAWTRSYKGGRVFTTTMGSADDLIAEGTRRMLVNAAYWCVGMEDQIKPNLDVSIVGEFDPTPFGFGKYIQGKRPADYDRVH